MSPSKINERLSFIRQKAKPVKLFYQRLLNGFDDSETYSLDFSLAQLILPRLKRFKELAADRGFKPGDYENIEDWHRDLDKMIAAFEFAGSDERWAAGNEEFAKAQEGLDLFAKNYFLLWW